MRRWIAGILVLILCGAALNSLRADAPIRLATAAFRVVENALALTGRLAALPVQAADELKDWTPVGADSVTRGARGARSRRATPEPPAAPVAPVSAQIDTLIPIAPPADPDRPIQSRHSGEMMRIGSDIHVESDQTVSGDVVAISGDVTVDGHVKGDVMAMRGDVYLGSSARIDGDVVCLGGELHEDSGAYVGGQRVTALGGRRTRISTHERVEIPVRRHLNHFVKTVLMLLIDLGLIWLLLRIAPGRSGQARDRLRRETAAALGVGLLTWVLLIPSLIALCLLVALLCITLIGIPVALAALFAYFVLLALLLVWGWVVGAAWLGEQVAGRGGAPMSMLRAAVTGAVLIVGTRAAGYLLHTIPWFGMLGGFLVAVSWIVTGVVGTLGAGALLRAEFAAGTVGQWWRGVRAPRNGRPAAASGVTGAAQPEPPAVAHPPASDPGGAPPAGVVGPATGLGIARPTAGSGEPPAETGGASPTDPYQPPPNPGG